MAKNLVIVESPAKSKTIKKFLGSSYKIEASMGHVIDLPKSQLGIDVENDFTPKYITIRGKGSLLSQLKKEAKKADKIYLATDPDREGEAIAWHLYKTLKPINDNIYRITFNQITKDAVKNAIKEARDIDMDLVDSQQARRALDRLVGYKISPLLWKKVKKGLSAGRVQSVALLLICEREDEIRSFIAEEYWSLKALFKEGGQVFEADFYGKNNKKVKLGSKEEVDEVLRGLKNKDYIVSDIKETSRRRKAPEAFKTSTLQQEAFKRLNFTSAKTMRIAQQLYEGVPVKGEGTIGLITYLRTDSTRIADEAKLAAKELIENKYGKEYLMKERIEKKSKQKEQDAHEGIRPTYVDKEPISIKDSLSRDQYRLYSLIWQRFIASRMEDAIYKGKRIQIKAGEYEFRASAQAIEFDGFLKVYGDTKKEEKGLSLSLLNKIELNSRLKKEKLIKDQHFTQPPARYTEASLVKTLEENGVGRPSTYAPTISTIQSRGYIAKEEKMFFPTELGELVNQMLKEYFSRVIDINFTADMEKKLDQVELGEIEWKEILREFYPVFMEEVNKAEEEIEKVEIKPEETDIKCEKCGRNMVIKLGRYGKFLACPGFPECRNTKPLLEKLEGVACPKCGGEIIIRKTKKGRRYYGCGNYPDCDFINWNEPTNIKCQKCSSMTVKKGKKLLCINEDCKNIQDNQEVN